MRLSIYIEIIFAAYVEAKHGEESNDDVISFW